jgi:hypothetical protein
MITIRPFLVFALLISVGVAVGKAQTVIGVSNTGFGSPGVSNGGAGYTTFGSRAPTPMSSIASLLTSPVPPVQAGPLAIRPHLSYEVSRGSGILRTPGAPQKVTTNTASAGVLLELGTRLTADYTLSRVWYSSTLSDATNHNLWVRGGITYDQWRWGLSGRYGSNSDVLVETGGQTNRDLYSTNAVVARQLGLRSELELNLSHTQEAASPVEGTATWNDADWTLWNASAWYRYHISQALSAAIGFAGGYDDITDSPDMSHTQPQVQITWQPTAKISLSAEGGIERRRTRAALARIEENGRYSGSLSYRPFQTTTLTVGAGRSVDPSYFSGQTTQSDSWNINLQQRFLTRLFLSVGASQRNAAYESALPGVFPGRDDRYNAFNVSLSTVVLGKGSLAVFYQRVRNRSSEAIYDFTSNQFGASLGYHF